MATPALEGLDSAALRAPASTTCYLTQYAQTTAKDSPPVEMLFPEGTPYPWFEDFGWVGQNVAGLAGATTVWIGRAGPTPSPPATRSC